MKIAVALKQVPSRDSILAPDAAGRWIREDDLSFEINEPDAYALEAALQLRDRQGGEVVAISVGPDRAEKSLREALAKGADRAIHILAPDEASQDAFRVAFNLAEAIRGEQADLTLTGLQSDDLGAGQTGVIVAELLGVPHATIIMQIEPREGGLRVRRELEGGWFQYIDMPLPAALTVQSGIAKLRYATLLGIKKARTKEVRRISAATPPTQGARAEIVRVLAPQHAKQTCFLRGDARSAAAELIEKLRFEARVL
jgi:electron transfer flavoprotein beta subunit